MAEQAPFFSPHEPPPSFAAPPADDALAQRISKLAQFAARNGPSFVDLMRTKQAGNAEYAFLNSGVGSGYWRWILYCTLYNLPVGKPCHPQNLEQSRSAAHTHTHHLTSGLFVGTDCSKTVNSVDVVSSPWHR